MTGNLVNWKMREAHLPCFRRKLRADKLYRLRVRLLLCWLQPLEGVCVQQFPEQRTPCQHIGNDCWHFKGMMAR